ncbi:DUF1360 domain-containing protein [Streptomyces chartreusis]|jgi:hypothetical protein|uniref:DUF1360 domain-containing protein n=1 Tax=Streptomyces chartreusis TaxID=1969 RepID=UPI002E182535
MDTGLLLLVMALATYRLTRLVVEDTFPPVLWLRDRVAGGWRPLTLAEHERYVAASPSAQAVIRDAWSYDPDDELRQRHVRRARWSPHWLAELLSCPWCASGWIAAGVTAGVWATVGLPMPLLVWPAVWAAGALIAAQGWA